MDRYLSLKEISRRASICERTLRRHLSEIPHSRMGTRGKIRIRWADFVNWMDAKRAQIVENDVVMRVLKEIHDSRAS